MLEYIVDIGNFTVLYDPEMDDYVIQNSGSDVVIGVFDSLDEVTEFAENPHEIEMDIIPEGEPCL